MKSQNLQKKTVLIFGIVLEFKFIDEKIKLY